MRTDRRGHVARAMRGLAKKTRAFICISNYVQHLVQSYGVPAGKCRLIHCGTDTTVKEEFPSRLREELHLDLDIPVIGTTGIWRPNKGFTYFISACERIHEWNPWARFFLGGKAYQEDAQYATALWMRGRILRTIGVMNFTGFQEDIGRFMSALDVFVLPSDCEPFGLVLLEAMIRGVPVVATREGGVTDIVTDRETGILVPPQDPEALAEAINYLITHPVQRHNMGEMARRRVQKHFDQKEMVQSYEALYREVAAGQP